MYTKHVVTGAFGYSGKYIAQRLVDKGHEVRTLTNSPNRPHPFGDKIQVHPYAFDEPDRLVEALSGAEVLYNTYWVRFDHRYFSHAEAVSNTCALFRAAKKAGIKRIVHMSITNAALDSPWEYFRSKAQLEATLGISDIPHTIIRPTVYFGHEDILLNNVAWALRRLPVFPLFGDGQYKLQPIHVEDAADLAVGEGQAEGKRAIDAIGPETFTFRELVQCIGEAIGKKRPFLPLPPSIGHGAMWCAGWFVRDVILTKDEVEGLVKNMLYVENAEPVGQRRLTDWAREHSDTMGGHYASELARRDIRDKAYTEL